MTASISRQSPVETIEWLTEQSVAADLQSEAAVNAVKNFADQIRNNKTPENLEKIHVLISDSELALARAAELHTKLWSSQLAAFKSKSAEPSLSLTLQQSVEKTSEVSTIATSLNPAPSRWAGRTRGGNAPSK